MKAMLHWKNGDRQEVTLHTSNLRPDGHPRDTLHARSGDGREGRFWLDIDKYRMGRVVFVEVP
jgi:hypothetical protein